MPIAPLPWRGLSASLALCAAACPALADIGGTVSVQSDGRFRGLSYSNGEPQVQATLAWDGTGGWYAGALWTQTRFGPQRRSPLWQAYAGRVVPLAVGIDAEAGLNLSHFSTITRYDYAEAYVGLLGERWNARLHLSNDYYGSQQRTAYVELNLRWPLAPALSSFAHLGVMHGSGGPYASPHGPTRSDLRVGAAWRPGIAELQLAWVAATAGGPQTWTGTARQQAWVVGFSAAF